MKNILAAIVLTAFLGALFSVAIARQSQDPGVLLRAAIEKEEVDGDLQKAIEMYKQIIAKYGKDHAVAAKAQLRIGTCLEKLGLREAQNAYQKVIDNYPGQLEEVAAAKECISRLSKVSATAPEKPKFRKIQITANPGNGVLSPDGKRLAFASEGSIWVVPIPGNVDPNIAGIPVRLTEPVGATNTRNTLAWSGDGRWIAFNTSLSAPSDSNRIFVVASTGGEIKKIAVQPVGNAFDRRLSLSPDGKTLAFSDERGTYTLSVNGGGEKRVIDKGWGDAVFSPDGTRLAYVITSNKGDGFESGIWVVDSLGGTPLKLRTVPGIVKGPTWSPDGNMIAFISDPLAPQSNDSKICIAPANESLPGSTNVLEIDAPLEPSFIPAGWTSQNTIGLLLGNSPFDAIYTVPSTGGRASQVSPAGQAVSHPKWSPDGKRIFFRGYGIFSIPSDGGPVASLLTFRKWEDLYEATAGGGNDVSPDGKKLVFSGARNIGKTGNKDFRVEVNIYTIPVEGGQPVQITAFPWDPQHRWAGQARFPCWSHDGKQIAFIRDHINAKGEGVIDIFAVPATGGAIRQITSESHRTAWAGIDWSPDGRHIAYFSQDKTVNILPVDGGVAKILAKVENLNGHMELSWSPDGKEIAFSDKGKIYAVSTDAGQPLEVKTGLETEAHNLAWSPDGKTIAFAATRREPLELWLMEDFLHLVKNKK